jgi:hypothetical protein
LENGKAGNSTKAGFITFVCWDFWGLRYYGLKFEFQSSTRLNAGAYFNIS